MPIVKNVIDSCTEELDGFTKMIEFDENEIQELAEQDLIIEEKEAKSLVKGTQLWKVWFLA